MQPSVRQEAAFYLAFLSEEGLQVLKDYFTDTKTDTDGKVAAVRGIGEVGDKSFLEDQTNSEDSLQRGLAQSALNELAKRDHSDNPTVLNDDSMQISHSIDIGA